MKKGDSVVPIPTIIHVDAFYDNIVYNRFTMSTLSVAGSGAMNLGVSDCDILAGECPGECPNLRPILKPCSHYYVTNREL